MSKEELNEFKVSAIFQNRLAQYFNVTMDYLLGRTDDR